ncbi:MULTISPECIES: glyoxalase [unclassified Nocardioides]|uniref:glyoxalase n=1 Tax=unclassified Nocardioides TaxID=2615069 RepID=UPI0006F78C7E|nr:MULTISPECIES: glyoxalase [unclassified Nocardioides]KRA39185.1 glyoxalase [Nocardioides sp. Root614]KRA93144.1 glyoxalase [Nocardioides sp. Root682]
MNTTDTQTTLSALTLEVADPAAARAFYADAFGFDSQIDFRATDAATSGFRGFSLSLTVAQPANVNALIDAAVAAGATVLKPVAKSFWGYGGVVQAPDGTIWKVATSNKKDTAPTSKEYDDLVLLLGATDVAATKRFYVERGLTVAKSYGRKYVEFDAGSGPLKLALYGRRALAKDVGVPEEGSGSHRIVLAGSAGPFSDPDGFVWEASA